MRLSKAWTIASKDLKIFRKKRNLIYSTFVIPIIISIGIPSLIEYSFKKTVTFATGTMGLIDGFSFLFVVLAAILPTAIASYAIIGEKVEKSLEPLLATPTTDGEILLGKSIAAFLPPIAAIYTSAIIFMSLIDEITFNSLGYAYYPNWSIGVILLLLVPLSALFPSS